MIITFAHTGKQIHTYTIQDQKSLCPTEKNTLENLGKTKCKCPKLIDQTNIPILISDLA